MRSDPYLKEIGARIQAIRKAKKITIRKLGEMCGLVYSSLCRLEGGQYASKITTLKSVADSLGVDVKDFL